MVCSLGAHASIGATPQLFEWERGFGLRVPGEPAAEMFLWIYEWNMFEAMNAGQHTHGTYQLPRQKQPGVMEAGGNRQLPLSACGLTTGSFHFPRIGRALSRAVAAESLANRSFQQNVRPRRQHRHA